MSIDQRRAAQASLRLQLLRYLTEPRLGRGLHQAAPLDQYAPREVRQMLYALHRMGDIQCARGRTSGAVWWITRQGRQVLQQSEPPKGE